MQLLSRREAAKLLGITDRHLDRLARCEGLPHVRLGRRVLVPKEELERWLATRVQRKRGQGYGQE